MSKIFIEESHHHSISESPQFFFGKIFRLQFVAAFFLCVSCYFHGNCMLMGHYNSNEMAHKDYVSFIIERKNTTMTG